MCEMYAKDSLDRFGDDLSQQLLSYLSLEDKFRFECISKQWQRVVYTTQTVFKINFTSNQRLIKNKSIFETIVKKCTNISSIYWPLYLFRCPEDKAIDLMNKYCFHLIDIQIDFSAINVTTIDNFFTKFGPQLKTMKILSFNESVDKKSIEKWLKMCVNLKSFYAFERTLRFLPLRSVTEILMPFNRLMSISFNKRSKPNIQPLVTFADKYGHQMKIFVFHFILSENECIPEMVNKVMVCLSRMPALVDLKLSLPWISSEELIPLFTQIGVNCRRLKSLDISVHKLSPQLIHTISERFIALKRLRIWEQFPSEELLSSHSLSHLKRLTHLDLFCSRLNNTSIITNTFFANIDHNLPKLQYLGVKYVKISDESLISLSGLRQIRGITLEGYTKDWKQDTNKMSINNLITKCPKLCFIHLNTDSV